MDKGNLDDRDRRNLYAPDAGNVFVVEMIRDEAFETSPSWDLAPELVEALITAADKVRGQTRVAYVVIKITE